MRKLLVVIVAAGLLLAGCNQIVNLTGFDHERFTMQVPEHWTKFDPNAEIGELAYLSDGKSADVFYEGSVGVYTYEGFFTEGQEFNQAYCDTTYDLISDPQFLTGFKEISKQSVQFVAAAADKPAYCDIAYELKNENTDDYVASQYQRQFLFIDGDDELIIEVASTKIPMPEYLVNVLNSFKVIPQQAEGTV